MATPQAPQYIGRRLPVPPGRRHALVRFLDERDPTGGRAKAALFLLHPGPSLLVTAVTVGAAGIALRAMPSPSLALLLVLLMLPAQFAIGTANALADLRADRDGKPHKPLVRGAVPSAAAWVITLIAMPSPRRDGSPLLCGGASRSPRCWPSPCTAPTRCPTSTTTVAPACAACRCCSAHREREFLPLPASRCALWRPRLWLRRCTSRACGCRRHGA